MIENIIETNNKANIILNTHTSVNQRGHNTLVFKYVCIIIICIGMGTEQ